MHNLHIVGKVASVGSAANAAVIKRYNEEHGFDAAPSTLSGIELIHMLRKGPLAGGSEAGLTAAQQFYALAA